MSLEFEIAREQALQQLDEVTERLARLQQEREERGPAPDWTPQPAPAPAAPARHRRAVEPRERPAERVGGVDWAATERWVRQIIDGRVGVKTQEFVTAVVEGLGDEAGRICAELRAEIRRQAARIEQLEARLFELALRQGAAPPAPAADAPAKSVPRLIGVGDAAD